MTWLAVALVGIGVGDLVRSTGTPRSRLVGHVTTPVVIVILGLLAGMNSWADWVALVLAAAAGAAWAELSRETQMTGRRALAPLGVFAGIVVALLGFSGAASHPDGPLETWLHWAELPGHQPLTTARVLLLTGLALFNLATANVIVRLVLLTIGALRPSDVTNANAAAAAAAASAGQPAPPTPGQPADRLKGGRLLGPMERLVILGLGLAGQFGAAGLVIAAKGLLRFPEIQAAARSADPSATGTYNGGPAGIDDVTEYFLVGSFVSWLIALGSLALTV
ncbi:hypothetical protein [Terrabacter sp. NPDC080008]|uniref:hypothetical protein n=1 Tax=Terrabacter sp. NPDC080008 TaxID=3155176 RepID=UPI00344DB869